MRRFEAVAGQESRDQPQDMGGLDEPVAEVGVSGGGLGEGGEGAVDLRFCGAVLGVGRLVGARGLGEAAGGHDLEVDALLPVIGAVVAQVGEEQQLGVWLGDAGEQGTHGLGAWVPAGVYPGQRGIG